jgi:hypothetical protein
MTAAICFSCGAEKFSAFTPCPACKSTPSGEEQLALSMALCEHLHSKRDLTVFAADIRAHRKLVLAPGVLEQAREALKDKQLVAMLGMVADRNQQEQGTQSKPTTKPPDTERPRENTLKVRADTPSLTALHRTAFGILGATTRDNRRRIVELAEAKSLTLDSDVCTEARSDLTNPRARLMAELAWLPGLSPKRAKEYCTLLEQDVTRCIELVQKECAIVRANVYSAAFELFDTQMDNVYWAAAIEDIARQVDEIESTDVLRLINEDREVAGFPAIPNPDLIESALSERRRYYKDSIKEAIDRLPTARMIQVITDIVQSATNGGTEPAPMLIDELVDSFEAGVRPFLDREADNARKLVKTTHDSAAGGERVVKPLLDKLDQVVRNWDKVAKPIHINMNVRGIEHEQSKALAYEIRNLGIDLYNKHRMLEQAQRVTNLLQEVFSELPEVADRLEEDAKAIHNIFEEREQSKRQTEQWAKEITYETRIGLVFKDTLRISPNGIEWKGVRCSLDSITGVGWGATRNSVNGIPTGTDYFISFCDSRNVTRIQTNREQVFSGFTDKLWKAAGVRLLTEMLEGLRAGKQYQFGNAILDDLGMELTKRHTFRANEKVRANWSQLHIWNADGSFYVGVKDDKEAYLALLYQAANNAHVLEAAIRMKFKNDGDRLSSILKGS